MNRIAGPLAIVAVAGFSGMGFSGMGCSGIFGGSIGSKEDVKSPVPGIPPKTADGDKGSTVPRPDCSNSMTGVCAPVVPPPSPVSDGLTLLDPAQTLRKAAFQLIGRLPTAEEYAAVAKGGLGALDALLDAMMDESAFYARLKDIFNDVFLTDRWAYEPGGTGDILESGLTNVYNPRDSRRWWRMPGDATYETPTEDTGRSIRAVGREPLEMVAYVVRNRRPFTEILAGRYRLFNPYSARVYLGRAYFDAHAAELGFKAWGAYASDDDRYADFKPIASLPRPPYSMAAAEYAGQKEFAGVVTTAAFMNRYLDSFTNKNRKRARFFLKYFLDFDILKAGQRIDLSLVDFATKPTLNEPACVACHRTIDAVAGMFQNWTSCYESSGVYMPATQTFRHCGKGAWYPADEIFSPAVNGSAPALTDPADLAHALELLSADAVMQSGFAQAMATHLFVGLTNRTLVEPPATMDTPGYANLDLAYTSQRKMLKDLGDLFVAANFDARKLIVAIIKTPYFRAFESDKPNRLEFLGMGGGTLTPPEVLHRKIASVVGYPWGDKGAANERSFLKNPHYLLGRQHLRLFYGGIDSDEITTRQRSPSGLGVSIQERMALEMACRYAAADFGAPKPLLFPMAKAATVPSGDPKAADQAGIVNNIIYLHERILGETLTAADAEIIETYKLLADVQKEGAAAVAAGKAPANLSSDCDGKTVWAVDSPGPGAAADPQYVVRAWQAVVAYLLQDYKFLFE